MSRTIDTSEELSKRDRQYLIDRGREAEVRALEAGSSSRDDEDVSGPPEPLSPPYDREGVTKKMLVDEIRRRNALPENAEYEDISLKGDKDVLAQRLVEDDEASEED